MKIVEVDKAIDLCQIDEFEVNCKPIYPLDFLPKEEQDMMVSIMANGYKTPRKVVSADYVEVYTFLNITSKENCAENFVAYLIENHKELNIPILSEQEAKKRWETNSGRRILKYKNILVPNDCLVIATQGDKIGLALLETNACILKD